MEVEDEGERFAPYLFDVRPRPLQHSRMVALSKRLTVCLRHDKGEFGLEWTPQAMTPLEKVLSLRIMQERGAKLEEVLAVVYHSDKKSRRASNRVEAIPEREGTSIVCGTMSHNIVFSRQVLRSYSTLSMQRTQRAGI